MLLFSLNSILSKSLRFTKSPITVCNFQNLELSGQNVGNFTPPLPPGTFLVVTTARMETANGIGILHTITQ